MPMSGLPEDAIERFFEKSSEKWERFQKFWKYTWCADFFQKSGTVFRVFGNIPDKTWTLSEFLEIYLMRKFFEKSWSDFGFSAYVLWWQPQKCLKEGIYEKSHDFFKGSRKKSGHSGKKLGETNIFEFFSKTVILKRPVRERNLMGTQWR